MTTSICIGNKSEHICTTAELRKSTSVIHNTLIPRLHDQANIKQMYIFKIRMHDVCSNCLMFAWSCKRGITHSGSAR